MLNKLHEEHYKLPAKHGGQIHLTRLYDKSNGAPLLLIAGLANSSSQFNQNGYAEHLARQGYDVYLLDLLGRSLSWPAITRQSEYSVHLIINNDLPLVFDRIAQLNQPVKATLVQGFYGPILMAFFAKFPNFYQSIDATINFGVRRLETGALKDYSKWSRFNSLFLAKLSLIFNGVISGKITALGDASEAPSVYATFRHWSNKKWIDDHDQFDYAKAVQSLNICPSLYFCGKGNHILAQKADVLAYMRELGPHNARLMTLGKNLGNKHNYQYQSMLSHKDAIMDHLEQVDHWLKDHIVI